MLQPGAILQRGYVVERVLGQGGMGVVYLARQNNLGGRRVAIKEIVLTLDDPNDRAQALHQFQVEANLLATVEHPGLVDVKDLFEENGVWYMVMAFIDGQTLSSMLEDSPTPLPVPDVLEWMDQLCDVLIRLHENQPAIIVRDLKPTNVMLDSARRIRLIDFGIARTMKEGQSTSTFVRGAATHGFAPVEQYTGGTDARSDIYSLGATMYVLLTRTLPPLSVARMSEEAELIPPSAINPAVSPQLEAVILKLMAIKKAERFQTVREVRAALQALPKVPYAGPAGRPMHAQPRRFCTECGSTLRPGAPSCVACGQVFEMPDTPVLDMAPHPTDVPAGYAAPPQPPGGGTWGAAPQPASQPASPQPPPSGGSWGPPAPVIPPSSRPTFSSKALVPAIFAFILCFPVGVVAVVLTIQAWNAASRGSMDVAVKKDSSATTWAWVGLVLGIFVYTVILGRG